MDSRSFRDTIGHFATGVTVITTKVDEKVHGMTANAVSSVSLDPMLLLVCVGHLALCHERLSQSDHFGVSILAEDQEDLSNHFAKSDPLLAESNISFAPGPSGTPLLVDCLAVFECRKHSVLDGGDHDIFVGRVEHGQIIRPAEAPLVFFSGAYRRLAEPSSPNA